MGLAKRKQVVGAGLCVVSRDAGERIVRRGSVQMVREGRPWLQPRKRHASNTSRSTGPKPAAQEKGPVLVTY